jgi:protease IV
MENQLPSGQVPPPLPPSQPPIFVTTTPPRRGGGGWMILSLILLLILGVFVASRMVRFMAHVGARSTGSESGRHFEEIVVENPEADAKIAIVPVQGMISRQFDPTGRDMVDVIEDQLKLAAKDSDVKAVILKIDSPGGEVMASDDISRALVQFQEKHNKPVIASMQGLAASGGYYVAAPCRWIVANELTITGSIGVILSSFNYRGLMDKVGLQPVVFKSGKFKDMLRGSKRQDEIQPEEQEMIQNMVMETYEKFKSVVRNGREQAASKNAGKGRKLTEDWEKYADGRILTGKTARDLGFVDQLGNFQTAVDTAREIASITGKARLVRYEEPFSLGRLLGLGVSSRAAANTQTLKIDLGVDLPKVQAGRMYFLSPTFAH